MKSSGTSGIRLLALDLDDTLLRSDLSISHRTRKAIKRVLAAGITVVLASGRIPQAMDRFSRLLGLDKRASYLISNNGALVQESQTGNIVHEARLEPRMALAVYNLADAEGFAVQMYEGGTMYVSRKNEYSTIDQKLTGLHQVVVENFRDLIGKGCYKLIIPGDPMLLVPLESLLRTYLGKYITLFTSRPYFLEIIPPATDKGTALAKIAEILGVKADETMAIGDSMNDEAMIRWAGTGVAMANADDRIKSIADLVAEHTNEEDGVAEIIDRYLFGRKQTND
ncbi:MAG: Cof-type HAD-IIB family hydrolase [Treponema sp.]|nr:Cof-type HAD-IIB family hydrolase [Treponema sp.]